MHNRIIGLPEIACPGCGQRLEEFATLHGPSNAQEIHFTRVAEFSTVCGKCAACFSWVRAGGPPLWSDPLAGSGLNDFVRRELRWHNDTPREEEP